MTTGPADFSAETLTIDAEAETARIVAALRRQLREPLHKRGLVLGLSGGINSTACAALAARAVGPGKVFCLFMPERDSDPESLRLGRLVAERFGLQGEVEDIGDALQALGCYRRRDAAVRSIVPEYGPGWGFKIVIADPLEAPGYNISSLVAQAPDGQVSRHRLTAPAYLAIVAATNMKQRVRKLMEYSHADRLDYAVVGTPNRLEYDQGFFVKNGDGSADVKPIAHLYKSQVYQLAAHLGVPEEILRRPPTTDTYSMAQTQEEFYFSLPYDKLDLCLYGLNQGLAEDEVARATGLTASQVELVWRDIGAKRKVARYLHAAPQLAAVA